MNSYFKSRSKDFTLIQGDCVKVMTEFDFSFDMIFADPPYFLSNDGISIQSGKPVCVNKGEWDRSKGREFIDDFNHQWLKLARDKLKDNGTIWVSGTFHNIFSIAQMLDRLDFKILNAVVWEKENPPPNLACRCLTHSSEIIVWARKDKKEPHYYNYDLMREINAGRQMRDVWKLPAIERWEKTFGKHPAQKPLRLLARIILASTQPKAWILDPFSGSGTTGIAANLLGRRFLGIEKEENFLKTSKARREELEKPDVISQYRNKLVPELSKDSKFNEANPAI